MSATRSLVSIRELATMLTALYPERGLTARFAPPREGYIASVVARSAPDTARLEKLGWRPRTGVAEGFERTIAIYSDIFEGAALEQAHETTHRAADPASGPLT